MELRARLQRRQLEHAEFRRRAPWRYITPSPTWSAQRNSSAKRKAVEFALVSAFVFSVLETGGAAMTRRIFIKSGYRIDKAGRLVPCDRHLNVSLRLKRRASKRIRPAKSGKSGQVRL